MPRIVSLIASATEIVCSLGYEDHLVGRSHECDYPESVQKLPVCTSPKLNVQASSIEIDRQVRALVEKALAVYDVNAILLEQLEPDVIVTQIQCEVCAVSLRDVERAVCSWLSRCPNLVPLKPDSLNDVWDDVEKVARAIDALDRGNELVVNLKTRMAEIAEQCANVKYKSTVACIEWVNPLMVAGNWMPELIEMAGGINLFGVAGNHAPGLTWEQLRKADPDVIILMPCGYDLERTRCEMPILEGKSGWKELKAVRNHKVFVTDGNQFFNRPGPRLVESLQILAEILYPDKFPSNHHGIGWDWC